MTKVALIDKRMGETIQVVETHNAQWTIDQLMRNRDPRLFIAKVVNESLTPKS